MKRFARYSALTALVVLSACSGDDDSGMPEAQAHPANAPAGTGARAGNEGRGAGRTASVTLAAADVGVVRRGPLQEGIAITGDLRPIETIEVRARIEGDLTGVFVREGERVRAGQLLARFEASEQESAHASAEADRVAAESEVATAQWNLEQTTELFRAGAVAERDFKVAQQNVTSARARLAAAQARVRASSSTFRDTRVLAPSAGIVSQRSVENGERVARGATMFTLVRNDVLELAAAVPARQASAVQLNQAVNFVADGRRFEGKVARISPTIDPASRSVAVFVQIPNASGALKGGTFASGRIISRVIPSALLVPSTAIRQSGSEGGTYVYRIANRAIDIVPVQVGVVDESAGSAEILAGLSEGDRVVVGHAGILGRGMQVIIVGEEGAIRGGASSGRN